MSNARLLIIDDEVQIRRLLEITLDSDGYDVDSAENGKDGMRMAASQPPDCIILDLGLPDESGHSILKKLREWYTKPIIILSIQNSEEDIVSALDNGANDYLVKPFRTGELLARIRSAMRSVNGEQEEPMIEFGDLRIDFTTRSISKKDKPVKLTVTEYKLLALLIQQEGKVLTHHYLLREIWGPGYINQTQYLRVFVAQLRKKIEDDPNRPSFIVTEPGVGYRFVIED